MSTIYDYSKPGTESPDLDQLRVDVLASAMSDKSIEGSEWNESDGVLHVQFENALGPTDKAILDGIVDVLQPLPDPAAKGEAITFIFQAQGVPADIYLDYGGSSSNVTPATVDRKRSLYLVTVVMGVVGTCIFHVVLNGHDVASVALVGESRKSKKVDVSLDAGDDLAVRIEGKATTPTVQLFAQGV